MVKILNIKSLLAVNIFVLLPLLSLGQERLIFQGSRTIGDYSGMVNFEYLVKDKDTVLDGSFKFGNVLKDENEANTNPIIVSGQFKNNEADGKWNFQFGDFSKNGEKKLVNYQYVIEFNGIQKSINFNLKNGKPDGKWLIQIDSLQNSEIVKTPFKSEFDYKEGIPQKSFRIETDTEFMVGRLLRNAVAHDVWSLYTKEGVGELESWEFNQGQLEQITIQIDGNTKQISLDYGQAKNLTTINLDKHYLDIMELRLQQQDTSHVFDHGMSNLLKTDSENYEVVLDFFKQLGAPLTVEGFRVNVPKFPLTKDQNDKMSLIVDRYKKTDSLIQQLLANPQLNILKLNDTETSFFYNVAVTLEANYLKPIGKLVTYQDEDVLRHITREELINGLWPNGFPKQVITFQDDNNNDRIYTLDTAAYDFSGQNLDAVLQLANFVEEVSNELELALAEKLSSNKREQAFLIKEQKLITSINNLKSHVDSLENGAPKDIKKTLESLKAFADRTLSSYSKMPENDEKLNRSQELTTCFKDTKNLATSIGHIAVQQSEVKDLYQDQVWNPFTATIMDEEVKKRITKAYNTKVIPFYLDTVSEDLTCAQVPDLAKDLKNLNERMLEMKDEDTKKLERKLKRADTVEEVLTLFGLANDL